MKQPHTEDAIDHTDGEQDTGNHKKPNTSEADGADRFGGTRAGSDNVEPVKPAKSVQSGPEVDQVRPLDQVGGNDVTGEDHAERAPECDERGRL